MGQASTAFLIRSNIVAPVSHGSSQNRLDMLTWIIRWILLMIMEASIVTEEIPGSSEPLPVFCLFNSSTCRDKPFLSQIK